MQPLNKSADPRSQAEIVFAGESVVLDASGALYLPGHETLIVSDLHLEKGSFFASRGQPMPCHDTRDTLGRLGDVIARYAPGCLICLGDSFHDRRASDRMAECDAETLHGLVSDIDDWIWITGNHDPDIGASLGGTVTERGTAGTITLVHRPEDAAPPLIAGHYHPKHRVHFARRSVSGPCFVIGAETILMPAFGAYAGGLSASSEPIAALFDDAPKRLALIYAGKLWFLE